MARWPHVTGYAIILSLWAIVSAAWGQAPAVWVFDEVTLKNGSQFLGVILKESTDEMEFQVVYRFPGRPTVTLTSKFTTREIAAVKRLSSQDRLTLLTRLGELELDPGGTGERKRMENLELTPANWLGDANAARQYSSDRFVLVSGASKDLTRLTAVRLEQIYAAFTRYLAPHHIVAQPTKVFLAGHLEDYRKLIGPTAGMILNPAIYEPATNRIVCGSDLRRLEAELNDTRKKHAQELAKIDKYEAEIRLLYRNSKLELDRFLSVVTSERERLGKAANANNKSFENATKRQFALLYHEAFHSYVATYVYPPKSADDVRAGKGTGELPRWLNEGLAQIFETAVIEAGELRVGHADNNRLDRVQPLKKAKVNLLPVTELLRAGKDSFLAAHADQKATSDRVYLTSWAVTFYLTFDRHLIGTKDFVTYLTTINTGGDPVQAFQNWVGQDVIAFEKDLNEYLARLLPDGTLAPRRP